MTSVHSISVRTAAVSVGLTLCGWLLATWTSISPAARASTPTAQSGEVAQYASPVELLRSSDKSQLYVLCQGTGEVRVLDARTYRELKRIDKVAYVRFASVYRSFEDVDEFRQLIRDI